MLVFSIDWEQHIAMLRMKYWENHFGNETDAVPISQPAGCLHLDQISAKQRI